MARKIFLLYFLLCTRRLASFGAQWKLLSLSTKICRYTLDEMISFPTPMIVSELGDKH